MYINVITCIYIYMYIYICIYIYLIISIYTCIMDYDGIYWDMMILFYDPLKPMTKIPKNY